MIFYFLAWCLVVTWTHCWTRLFCCCKGPPRLDSWLLLLPCLPPSLSLPSFMARDGKAPPPLHSSPPTVIDKEEKHLLREKKESCHAFKDHNNKRVQSEILQYKYNNFSPLLYSHRSLSMAIGAFFISLSSTTFTIACSTELYKIVSPSGVHPTTTTGAMLLLNDFVLVSLMHQWSSRCSKEKQKLAKKTREREG